MINAIRRLWTLKTRYGLTWAKALDQGIQGLQRYEDLDRRYEQERDAKRMVADALTGPGAPSPQAAEPVVSVHDY